MATPFEYEPKNSRFAKIGVAVGAVLVLAVGALLVRQLTRGGKAPPRREQEMVMIKPLAPPPPPPPPPPPVPPQQVPEQTQVTEQDMKPDDQPAPDPSPSLGTGLTGNGPDAFGLGTRDRGMIAGTGAGGVKGNRFGGYFNQVVQAVTDALGRHEATRNASFDVRIKVWTDATGRVTRVKLLQSTGNELVDAALRGTALVGRQLPDLPPEMRLPLELRLNLRRPN